LAWPGRCASGCPFRLESSDVCPYFREGQGIERLDGCQIPKLLPLLFEMGFADAVTDLLAGQLREFFDDLLSGEAPPAALDHVSVFRQLVGFFVHRQKRMIMIKRSNAQRTKTENGTSENFRLIHLTRNSAAKNWKPLLNHILTEKFGNSARKMVKTTRSGNYIGSQAFELFPSIGMVLEAVNLHSLGEGSAF